MKGPTDRISICTTTHFDGIIAVVDPERSRSSEVTKGYITPEIKMRQRIQADPR
ncbi:hypothetical protein PISMIDRAFT_682091 [Pisolithus microcarpus 441]|uniref:Uncharacterized protein n=1 Tax=Pisolithus microcarpus 441 TaxID=765257 RepID=A0A0C9ZLD6_9AGAM|nr:hypothetical protein PISMIDRAFT_682091 [Pisolithus microcarpus 441]